MNIIVYCASWFNDPILAAYIQILVGLTAIAIAIITIIITSRQYKANKKSSEDFNTKTLQEFNRLTNVITNQQEISEKQLIEIRNLSKPIIIFYDLLIIPSKFQKVIEEMQISFHLKNIGKRTAKEIKYHVVILDKLLGNKIIIKESILAPILYSDIDINLSFIHPFIDDYKFIVFLISWYDDDLTQMETQENYYKIRRIASMLDTKECNLDEIGDIKSKFVLP